MTNKIRDLFKVKLYTIRSETKERERERERISVTDCLTLTDEIGLLIEKF